MSLSLLPGWAGIFSQQWMKTLTFVVIVSMLYHLDWHP